MLRPTVITVIENKITIVCMGDACNSRHLIFHLTGFLLSELCCRSILVKQSKQLLNNCFMICESASCFW